MHIKVEDYKIKGSWRGILRTCIFDGLPRGFCVHVIQRWQPSPGTGKSHGPDAVGGLELDLEGRWRMDAESSSLEAEVPRQHHACPGR